MKYLPLIWSAVMRKPTRTILTLLSVTVAFTLFGLMIGFNNTIDQVEARARPDRSVAEGYIDMRWLAPTWTVLPSGSSTPPSLQPGKDPAARLPQLRGSIQVRGSIQACWHPPIDILPVDLPVLECGGGQPP